MLTLQCLKHKAKIMLNFIVVKSVHGLMKIIKRGKTIPTSQQKEHLSHRLVHGPTTVEPL